MDDFAYIGMLGRMFFGQFAAEDVPAFVERARQDGLGALCLLELEALLPADLREVLSAEYASRMGQFTRNEFAISKLCAKLEKHGIRYAPIKGTDLAYRIYPAIGLRLFVDWDFLFHPDDMQTALDLLDKSGWKSVYHDAPDALHHHVSPRCRDGFVLEPHRLCSGFGENSLHEVWKLLCPVGNGRFILPPELNIIMLARHASANNYRSFSIGKLLADCYFIIEKEGCNWQRVKQLCRLLDLPDACNFLAAFTEFWPEDILSDMEADSSAVNAYRQILSIRGDMANVSGFAMELKTNDAKGTFRQRLFNKFHPRNVRIREHLPVSGAYFRLFKAYVREIFSKLACVLKNVFVTDSKVDRYAELLKIAEKH